MYETGAERAFNNKYMVTGKVCLKVVILMFKVSP